MRTRVTELEKMCTCLHDEVDQSRSESLERRIIDEASWQALKTLHRQISSLEGQNRKLVLRSEDREIRIREFEASEEDARAELEQLRLHIDELEETNAELRAQLEFQSVVEEQGDLHKVVRKLEHELVMTKDKLEAQGERTEKTDERVLRPTLCARWRI